MSDALTQQAFRIADESMIAQLESHAVPMPQSEASIGRRFGLCGTNGAETSKLSEADPAITSAFDWLRQRGLAALHKDGDGEFIELGEAKDDSGEKSASQDIVPVWYWDSLRYNSDGDEVNADFMMDIEDHRASSGQLYATLATRDGHLDDMISATIEVNRLPGSRDDVPCLHLHFDADNVAASFYKQGDKIVVRPESNVRLLKTVLPNGEHGWILE